MEPIGEDVGVADNVNDGIAVGDLPGVELGAELGISNDSKIGTKLGCADRSEDSPAKKGELLA